MSSLEMTAGVELIAAMLSIGFMGALFVVAYDYHVRFPDDKLHYRLIVGTMMSISIFDTILACTHCYTTQITHFGLSEFIDRRDFEFCALFPCIGVSCTILQSFLVYRIYVVSAKRWRLIPAITMALTLTGASMSLYVAAWLPGVEHSSDLEQKSSVIWAWYVCHAVSDLLTTGSLLYFLVWIPYRSGGGLSRSVTLQRVAMRAVESNALSLVWQTLVMSFFASANKTGFIYTIPAYTLVKIYTYSLISALNTRNSHLDEMHHSSSGRGNNGAAGVTSIGGGGGGAGGTTFKRNTIATRSRFEEIQVTVVQDVDVDEYTSQLGEGEEFKMSRIEEGGGPVRVDLNQREGAQAQARERTKAERVRDLGLAQEKW